MADPPVDQRFAALCEIVRAQHFAWHAAVRAQCPSIDPMQVTLEMWRRTGQGTGSAYARRIKRELPVAPQIAASICWSSQCMGEDAHVESGENPREAFVVHRACPWQRWHVAHGLVHEDRPGCDEWFRATLRTVNDALGTDVRFETLESLPEGGGSCRRRLWE